MKDARTGTLRIAVVGDRQIGHEPQDSIAPAIEHAAAALGLAPPAVEWIGTERLAAEGDETLRDASAVWCAPGSPFRSLDGALTGIRWARESGVPFLGTCAGFQHAVIEIARNVLHAPAAHAEYGSHGDDDQLFIDELLCSLVGQELRVELVDRELQAMFGAAQTVERYYCRFGLNPKYLPLMAAYVAAAAKKFQDV